jgi:putative transposase
MSATAALVSLATHPHAWGTLPRRSADHVFVERLWKSVKYEPVYVYAYDSVTEARTSLTHYLGWYNHSRPHSSLGKQTPDEAYAVMLPTDKPAA